MANLRSNRLLPIIGGTVAVMAAFVGLKSCGSERVTRDHAVMQSVPTAPAADADSPAETIKTLTARVAEVTNQMKALRNENEQLQQQSRDIEETVTTRVKRDLGEQRAHEDKASTSVLSALTQRIDQLASRFSTSGAGDQGKRGNTTTPGSDIPVGLGLSGTPGSATAVTWVEPLDRASQKDNGTGGIRSFARRSESLLHKDASARDDTAAPEATSVSKTETKPLPVYTVPRNATLIGSTAMTALIGRVPLKGKVQDAMPFKLLVGADNLAANGITIPGVEGMVWSGTAVGDWTLSCVTGRLTSVTFVFQDGTIRTISSDDQAQQLGWISDERGIPCITGERITNAVSFLSQRIGVTALQAGADAAAQSETTTTVSGTTGTGTTTVTGDVGSYVLGKTVAGGAAEIRKWLDERFDQSFDAVFVKPGIHLAVHVDKQLDIDYDSKGRKVSHAQNLDLYRRNQLD
jgi:integrating conjugative element protein (TIGR03752 family)